LSHLKQKGKNNLSIEKLDKMMQNIGKGQFNYDVFKAAYDADPKLQDLVTNFDKEKIELKQDETDDVEGLPGNPGRPDDPVGQMAKNATDVGASL
jgi:hypothetical protein